MANADNCSSGVGGGGGAGGSDWEVVSLTASTYAAAPGPVLPLLPDSHENTELPPAADSAAIFMSQHFNLPAEALLTDLNEEEESNPAMVDGEAASAEDLDMQNDCQTEMLGDGLTRSDFLGDGDGLQEGALVSSAIPVAVSSSGVASVTANKGPSSSKVPCEAQAWWNKTFAFLRSNSKQPVDFRFVFVAATIVGPAILGQRDKLQLRLEFNVDRERISCPLREPLGQVKLNMHVGGSPAAQG